MSTPTRRSSRRVSSSSSRQASEADRQENEPMDTSDLARPLPQSSSPVPPSGSKIRISLCVEKFSINAIELFYELQLMNSFSEFCRIRRVRKIS